MIRDSFLVCSYILLKTFIFIRIILQETTHGPMKNYLSSRCLKNVTIFSLFNSIMQQIWSEALIYVI